MQRRGRTSRSRWVTGNPGPGDDGEGYTTPRCRRRSPSVRGDGRQSGFGRGARIRGWRRSSRPWRCHSSPRPSPWTGRRRPAGSARRRPTWCTGSLGMMNDRVRASLSEGHVQRVEHQLGAQVIGHRPAHHAAAEHIEHHGEIDEPGRGRDVGDVGDPQPVRALGVERGVPNSAGSKQPISTVVERPDGSTKNPRGQCSRHRRLGVQTSTSTSRLPFRRRTASPFDPADFGASLIGEGRRRHGGAYPQRGTDGHVRGRTWSQGPSSAQRLSTDLIAAFVCPGGGSGSVCRSAARAKGLGTPRPPVTLFPAHLSVALIDAVFGKYKIPGGQTARPSSG